MTNSSSLSTQTIWLVLNLLLGLVVFSTGFAPSIFKGRQLHTLNNFRDIAPLSLDTDDRNFILLSNIGVPARTARIVSPISAVLAAFLGPNVAFAAKVSGDAFDVSLKRYFPGSLQSSVITLRVLSALRKRNYRQYNVIFAASLCPDEINNSPQSLVRDLANVFVDTKSVGIYNLGGQGGIPFAGTLGFSNFVSHCPENGKLLILFGPHVGISEGGQVGKVERIGQTDATPSCAAVVDAYNGIKSKKKAVDSGIDLEGDYIISRLQKQIGDQVSVELQKGGGQVDAFLATQMFEIIYELLQSQVDTVKASDGFWSKISEITLLGGIVINRGHGSGTSGGEDFFQPLLMKTLSANGEVDLYEEVFGDLKTPRRN